MAQIQKENKNFTYFKMEIETTPAEIIVRSSVQVFMANPDNPKPEVFGSGCILDYKGRTFFISVSHVTDYSNLATYLESNLPFDERGPILHNIGGLCYWDIFKVKPTTNFEDFESIIQNGKRLDITFAEIKRPIDLLQPDVDFGAFKVNAGRKFKVSFEKSCLPNLEDEYGFYGKIRHQYEGKTLKMVNTFKHKLKYSRDVTFDNHRFNIFLAQNIIRDKEDYEGCSGAPIFDYKGNIVAIACAVKVNSQIVYGFPIDECKKLLDYSLEIGMI